jgi:hypothetical protein
LNGGMSYREPAQTPRRRTQSTILKGDGVIFILAALVAVSAALIGVRVYQSRASSSSSAVSPIDMIHGDHHDLQLGGDVRGGGEPVAPQPPLPQPAGAGREPEAPVAQAAPGRRLPEGDQRRRGARGEADGAVPDGTTVFDDEIPGVANLDAALRRALRQAATDAADEGVEFFVTSGWRSPEYQEQLRREAIAKYGSEKEAARWVATAGTSAHVSGGAVDIRPSVATAWLSKHGARYGLCQIYRNEPWHYELRPKAIDHGCPPMYADPTHDPRMQQ